MPFCIRHCLDKIPVIITRGSRLQRLPIGVICLMVFCSLIPILWFTVAAWCSEGAEISTYQSKEAKQNNGFHCDFGLCKIPKYVPFHDRHTTQNNIFFAENKTPETLAFFSPAVLGSNSFFFGWCKIILYIEGLPYLLWCFPLDHTSNLRAC